jgi:hypothetical protein
MLRAEVLDRVIPDSQDEDSGCEGFARDCATVRGCVRQGGSNAKEDYRKSQGGDQVR